MTKRVLFISPIGCLPPDQGNRARILEHINQAEQLGYEVWFYALGLNEEETKPLSKRFGNRLVCSRYALTRQVRPIARKLARLGMVLAVRSGLVTPPVDYWFQPQWAEEIARLAAVTHFDTVIAEYVFSSRALNCFSRETRKIIDTHDVFFARAKALRRLGMKDSWFRTNARNERRGLQRSDLVFSIQDQEAVLLRQLLQDKRPVLTVGHCVPNQTVWSFRPGLMTIGFLASNNSINLDGIQWFIREIWPEVRREFPQATLRIGGGICTVMQAGDGIELMGTVRDPAALYADCALSVNPVRMGSGLKIKTVEALGCGMPLVTNSVGASGLEAEANKSFLLADDPAQFAKAIGKLFRSPQCAQSLSADAAGFIKGWNLKNRQAFAQAIS